MTVLAPAKPPAPSPWAEPLPIGNLVLHSRVLQSPLSGVTDLPFRRLVRRHAPQSLVYTEIKQSTSVEILHIDIETDAKAWQLLMSREDKNWSLVDCSSLIIMQQRSITEALTNDNHCKQAGFIRLLK